METTRHNFQKPQPVNVAEAKRKQTGKARRVGEKSGVTLLEKQRVKASRAATTTPPITPKMEKLAEEERKSLENEKPVTLEEARAQVARHHMIRCHSKKD